MARPPRTERNNKTKVSVTLARAPAVMQKQRAGARAAATGWRRKPRTKHAHSRALQHEGTLRSTRGRCSAWGCAPVEADAARRLRSCARRDPGAAARTRRGHSSPHNAAESVNPAGRSNQKNTQPSGETRDPRQRSARAWRRRGCSSPATHMVCVSSLRSNKQAHITRRQNHPLKEVPPGPQRARQRRQDRSKRESER